MQNNILSTMAPLQRHQETTISDVGGSSRMPTIDKKTIPLSESIVDSAPSSASASASPSSSQQETKQNDKNTSLASNNDDSKKKDADHATNNGTIDSFMFH
jgi:hypothetical protein